MARLFSSTSSLVEVDRIDNGLGQEPVGEVGCCCDGQAKAPGVSFFTTSATDKVSFGGKAAPSLLGEAAVRDENQSLSFAESRAEQARMGGADVKVDKSSLSAAACWTLVP